MSFSSRNPYNSNPSISHSYGRNMYSRSGNRDKVTETNVTLMELENNQRWAELGEQVDLLKEVSFVAASLS